VFIDYDYKQATKQATKQASILGLFLLSNLKQYYRGLISGLKSTTDNFYDNCRQQVNGSAKNKGFLFAGKV